MENDVWRVAFPWGKGAVNENVRSEQANDSRLALLLGELIRAHSERLKRERDFVCPAETKRLLGRRELMGQQLGDGGGKPARRLRRERAPKAEDGHKRTLGGERRLRLCMLPVEMGAKPDDG